MKIAILSCGDFSVIGSAEKHTIDLARALDTDIISPEFNEDIVKTYDINMNIKLISLNKYHLNH